MFNACILSLALLSNIVETPLAEPQSRWETQEQRKNVELYSESRLDTEAIWTQLEDVSRELQQHLNVSSSGQAIQVMLFRNQKNYLNFLVAKIPQAARRKAIYYRNGEVSQIFVYESRSLMTDLRHEMTHAILHQHLPFLPLWLDEGLAEYFEYEENARISSSRIATVQWKARVGATPSLVSLETIPTAESMDAGVYRDSWAWVSFLLNGSPETRGVLENYLAAIHRGEAPGPLSVFAAARISDFQGRANSYFKKFSFRVASRSSRKP